MRTNDKHFAQEARDKIKQNLSQNALKALMDLGKEHKCRCAKLALTIANDHPRFGSARSIVFETDAESLNAYIDVLYDLTDIFEDLTHLPKAERLARLKKLKADTNANYVKVDGKYVS